MTQTHTGTQTQTEQHASESHGAPQGDRHSLEAISGGSVLEALGGLVAIALCIAGLAGAVPIVMAAVAEIILGVALMIEGGAIAARFSALLRETASSDEDMSVTASELGGGVSAEYLGGTTGVVLGALSLAGIAPMYLLPITAIVFGCILVLGAAAVNQLSRIRVTRTIKDEGRRGVAHGIIAAAAGTQVLVGLAVLGLGIAGTLQSYPLTLALIAMIVTGAGILLVGSAVGARMMRRMKSLASGVSGARY